VEKITLAIGSNSGDRLSHMRAALDFCTEYSQKPPVVSSLYESDPIGPADQPFLNAVIQIFSDSLTPADLLKEIKIFEESRGRNLSAVRWSNRPVDIDIIGFGEKCINSDELMLPHPAYRQRPFVLLPLKEIDPKWADPADGSTVESLIETAPFLRVYKTALKW